jgi:hypothetical protein
MLLPLSDIAFSMLYFSFYLLLLRSMRLHNFAFPDIPLPHFSLPVEILLMSALHRGLLECLRDAR